MLKIIENDELLNPAQQLANQTKGDGK